MKKLKDCLTNFKESHLFFLFMVGCLTCADLGNSAVATQTVEEPSKTIAMAPQIIDSSEILKDSAANVKESLVQEVAEYMRSFSKDPRITPEHMVNACVENEFDITLAMSQAHLETHFGASAKKSNSCFGVKHRTYKSADESVDDYIELMQSKYIINRNVDELIKSNFAQEKSPKYRYAGDNYARKIKIIRNKIIKETQIQGLYEQYSAIRKRILAENKKIDSNYSIMSA